MAQAHPPPAPLHDDLSHPTNPVVFLDITLAGEALGRIKIELFADVVPRTAENFRQLCTGEYSERGRPVGYKGARIHRVVSLFINCGLCLLRGDAGQVIGCLYIHKGPPGKYMY